MAEIANVTNQLEEIVSSLKIPVFTGGSREDYLCAVARGLIQFVCVRDGREFYRSLTADRILIHPGSVMFRKSPDYIVAGEIVRTTRMYAMSVSPLPYKVLAKISPALTSRLSPARAAAERRVKDPVKIPKVRDFTNHIKIGSEVFEIETVKGKKQVKLPWEKLKLVMDYIKPETASMYKGLRGIVVLEGKYTLLVGEKLQLILSLVPTLGIEGAPERYWFKREQFNSSSNLDELLTALPNLVRPALWKQRDKSLKDKPLRKKELGFLSLFTDGEGNYRLKCSRGFHTSLNESLASMETLIDELGDDVGVEKKHIVNQCYRRLSDYLS
jgi:hypothetical protein